MTTKMTTVDTLMYWNPIRTSDGYNLPPMYKPVLVFFNDGTYAITHLQTCGTEYGIVLEWETHDEDIKLDMSDGRELWDAIAWAYPLEAVHYWLGIPYKPIDDGGDDNDQQ